MRTFDPLRIAFLSEHASPLAPLGSADAGGQNVYVDEVSRNLACLGHQVDVFTRRDAATAEEVVAWAPGVRVIHVPAGPAAVVPKDDLWPFMPEFRDAFLRFASRQPAPYELVHGNFWMSGWVAAEIKERLGLPAVQIFHATGKTKQRHQGSADTSPSGRIEVEREVVQRVDALIAQCPFEWQELVADYGATEGNVHVIPSAVNTSTFRPLDRNAARRHIGLDLTPDDLVVVYVGRMMPRKDVRTVVRAVALLVQETDLPVRLLLVGGETPAPDPVVTPEIGVLQALAAELGIAERVHFTGRRQPEVLHHYYSAGDVVVTTPWYEPFGLTPLEGMACGRPVVGSAVGGITYTIVDGETGFLVPPRDPRALAGRLHLLLADQALCDRMGRNARERVEREFTWRLVARRTAALYRELVSSESGRAAGRSARLERVGHGAG